MIPLETLYSETVAERELVSSRLINAPRDLLFRAWLEPQHLKRWWGPKGFTNTFDEFDPRPGGTWRFTMHGPDGVNYKNTSVFSEIVPPERLVIRHTSSPRFELTATLTDEAGKTRLTWRMLFESAEDCARVKPICVEANEQNFDRLEAELATMAPAPTPAQHH